MNQSIKTCDPKISTLYNKIIERNPHKKSYLDSINFCVLI